MAPKAVPSRLAQSAYNSPYSHIGAPQAHPTLTRYDPKTMVERGVTWAEGQDPFGRVAQAQYMHFFGLDFHRVMEGYDEFLNEQEYKDMIEGRTVIPAVRKYEVNIRRQVTYPDSLIIAYRQELTEPTYNGGTTSVFSLKQQAIVANCKGSVTYMDAKTRRPIDIRTVGGGWAALYQGLVSKSNEFKALQEKSGPNDPKSKM
ncbi:hypothetical protein F5Y19DRAFT_486708 [Xylariaceae sp. FL1651]|nr:hypothetical protein F5Y19DRAFT_486708 [Xylariaceae sp. FL1651]